MAIHHLLYACVACGREAGIKPTGAGEVCERCGARYARGEGALIRCERADGTVEVRHPAEWLDRLGQSGLLEESRHRPEPVVLSIATTWRPYHHAGVYLGQVERFGEPMSGVLTLTDEALTFEPENGQRQTWPLDELTAVQPSSTTLQLKIRRGPVLSLRFPAGSPLLWEERIRNAVQKRYAEAGRGEIAEFQPRIVCR
ncbi:MAG TPA: hypothetical protein VK864_14170 [Longimicrobiales bacterium]|nr:hypothetical protein [Longimicrobiales bacterium]